MILRASLALTAFLAVFIVESAVRDASAAPVRATTQSKARVISPLKISQTKKLNFGTLKGGRSAGTVTVNTNGSVRYSGGASAGRCDDGDPSAGAYSVTGEPGRTYSIVTPTQVMVTGKDDRGRPGPTLKASAFEVRSQVVGATGSTGRLNSSGKDTLSLGAKIDVPANTPSGSYATNVVITVAYN